MEVTLVHPKNKDQKVVVTNQVQYDAFKKQGFVDVPNKKSDVKEAQSKPLATKPEDAAQKSVEESKKQKGAK